MIPGSLLKLWKNSLKPISFVQIRLFGSVILYVQLRSKLNAFLAPKNFSMPFVPVLIVV